MEICVLGLSRVVSGDGRSVLVRHQRARALLACLAARPRRLVPRDLLAEEVWGGAPPDAARTTVRSYVARLRRELAPVAEATGVVVSLDGGYLLDVEDDQVDWIRFSRDVEAGTALLAAGRVADALEAAQHALASWGGPPFLDLPCSPRAQELVAQLDQLRLRALEVEGEAMLLADQHEELVPRLAGLVVEHPLEERFWELLLRALLRCGRRAEALAAYGQAQASLQAELGVGPGPRLRAACALAHEVDGREHEAGASAPVVLVPAPRDGRLEDRRHADRRQADRRAAAPSPAGDLRSLLEPVGR